MVAQSVLGAPSWTSSTTTSAPAALSSAASSLVADTMSVTVSPAMPSGLTSDGRCSVTAPTKPTVTPATSVVQDGAISSAVPGSSMLAAMYSQSAPPLGLVSEAG